MFHSYTQTADSYQARGVYPQAEKYYRLAFAAARKAYGEKHELTASSLNRIGQACYFQGRYLQARSCFRLAHQ